MPNISDPYWVFWALKLVTLCHGMSLQLINDQQEIFTAAVSLWIFVEFQHNDCF